MLPREARESLAEAIRAVLPESWAVYAAPPDGPLSAHSNVVLVPESTYAEKGNTCLWVVKVAAVVALPLASGQAALDQMDDVLFVNIIPAIDKAEPPTTVLGVGSPGPIQEAAGVQYLTTTVNLEIYA